MKHYNIETRTSKKAFTLAETLIALAIIGVIAAITVPALIQNTQKQEYVSALKKAYSTLSQATQQIIMEEGSPKCDDGGWACTNTQIYEIYKNHLNNAKECGLNTGCFTQGAYKLLNGQNEPNNSWDTNNSFLKLITADGIQIGFGDWKSVSCKTSGNGSNNICYAVYADINGEKKPNIVGRDVFVFVLKETGLYPEGCDNEEENNCKKDSSGRGCACKVLREGAMNY